MSRVLTPAELRSEVAEWAERIRVKPARIEVRPLKSKWASCSAGGRLILSRDLLRARPELRAYVVVHELLHLRVPNHGKLFRRLLGVYLPGEKHRSPRGLLSCSL